MKVKIKSVCFNAKNTGWQKKTYCKALQAGKEVFDKIQKQVKFICLGDNLDAETKAKPSAP